MAVKIQVMVALISTMVALTSSAFAQEPAVALEPNCPTVFPEQMSDQFFRSYVDTLNEDRITDTMASALVGVDSLGRIAIAIDYESDGFADEALLLTASKRLDGPWSRHLTDAKVKIKRGSVQITSKSEKYAMSLAVRFANQPSVPGWASESTVHSEMLEFASTSYSEIATPLSSISHEDMLSWPEHFSYDLLDPGTVNCTNECDAGGQGATGCSITDGVTGNGCSVSGCMGSGEIIRFACCTEAGFFYLATCRCVTCQTGNQNE